MNIIPIWNDDYLNDVQNLFLIASWVNINFAETAVLLSGTLEKMKINLSLVINTQSLGMYK